MQQHDRADHDPQERERPHADATTQQLVDPGGRAGGRQVGGRRRHGVVARSWLRSTTTRRRVRVVPRRHDRLEVARLVVARRVRRDPVQRGGEEGELVGEPGVGVVADLGMSETALGHQLRPSVAVPRLVDRDALPVVGHPARRRLARCSPPGTSGRRTPCDRTTARGRRARAAGRRRRRRRRAGRSPCLSTRSSPVCSVRRPVAAGRPSQRSRGQDLGLLRRELLLGEDALVLELGQLAELREHVVGGRGSGWRRGLHVLRRGLRVLGGGLGVLGRGLGVLGSRLRVLGRGLGVLRLSLRLLLGVGRLVLLRPAVRLAARARGCSPWLRYRRRPRCGPSLR